MVTINTDGLNFKNENKNFLLLQKYEKDILTTIWVLMVKNFIDFM